MTNKFINRITNLFKGKGNAPELQNIHEDENGNRHINLSGDFENMSAEDLGLLFKQIGEVIREENENNAPEDDEVFENLSYYYDEDGTLFVHFLYDGTFDDLTEENENLILEMLDCLAKDLGQTNEYNVVKCIQDRNGMERRIMKSDSQGHILNKEEMIKMFEANGIPVNYDED